MSQEPLSLSFLALADKHQGSPCSSLASKVVVLGTLLIFPGTLGGAVEQPDDRQDCVPTIHTRQLLQYVVSGHAHGKSELESVTLVSTGLVDK